MSHRKATWLAAGALLLMLVGCNSSTKEDQSLRQQVEKLTEENKAMAARLQEGHAGPTPVNLLEPAYLNPQGGTDSWPYRKSLQADLDGDGQTEKVMVVTNPAADPETKSFGWDDGHAWHVYVEEADGTRTPLFARWVQLGRLEVTLGEKPAGVIIQQSTGVGTSIYQVTYKGPGKAEAVQLFEMLTLDRATFPAGFEYQE